MPRRASRCGPCGIRIPFVLRKNAKIELSKHVPLFSRCSKRELAAAAAEADELVLPEGRALATQGARGSAFVVIIEGAADVSKNGRRITRRGRGAFLARKGGMPR